MLFLRGLKIYIDYTLFWNYYETIGKPAHNIWNKADTHKQLVKREANIIPTHLSYDCRDYIWRNKINLFETSSQQT